MKRTTLKILTLGGLVGPILFTIIILVSAYLRSDYDHMHNFISELGATNTPNEQLMNFAGFMPSGLLIGLFGISLLYLVPKNIISKIGSLLVIIFGLGMTLAGTFSCDLGCPPTGSLESIIHNRVSAVTFISVILGIILLGVSFRKSEFFRKIALYSVISGIISAFLLIVMINSSESKILTGLWQRLLLFSIFLWTSIVGLRIFREYNELKPHNKLEE